MPAYTEPDHIDEQSAHQRELIDLVGGFYADPLHFVTSSFPWGVPGSPLEKFSGPDEWQRQELREIGRQVRERAFDGFTPVSPIRRAVASGHGIGKSALTAWFEMKAPAHSPRASAPIMSPDLAYRPGIGLSLDKEQRVSEPTPRSSSSLLI